MNHSMIRIARNLFLALAFTLFLSASMRADDAASTFKAKCAGCHGPDGKGNTPAGKAVGRMTFLRQKFRKCPMPI